MTPLVSCILATRDRPAFLRQALRCFSAQDYPNKELIVVDDGATSAAPFCAGVRDLTYIRLRERTPTGAKLNLGIEASRGSILQKIDDDDFYAPAFLSTAAARLLRARRADAVVTWCCFVVLITGEPVLYFSGHGWMTGGTLCFHRQLWERHRFRNIYRTSDGWFIRDARPFVARVCDPEQYIVVRHGGNTWRRIEGQPSVEGYLRRRPYHKKVREIVGRRNGPFYEALMARPLNQS